MNIARCQGVFADRDCSISRETGDLTLGSVRIEDEGPYVCRKSFSDGTRYRLRQLNVNGKIFITNRSRLAINLVICCQPVEIKW